MNENTEHVTLRWKECDVCGECNDGEQHHDGSRGDVCAECCRVCREPQVNLETVEFEGTFISTRPNVLGRTFLYALPRGRFLEVAHTHGQAGEIDLKTYESLAEYLGSSPSADGYAADLRVQMMPDTSVVQ